jgi:trimethylamine--corrinoid protein Co-methyltransferase
LKTERGDVVNEACAGRPEVSFLREESRQRIHQAALHILERTGMEILHAKAVGLLKAAGCGVERENLVRIPRVIVERAVQSAPKDILIFDREGESAMNLGGYRSYFGTGSDLLYTIDPDTGERRRCILEDVRRAAVLCDALPNIDFVMSFAHPSDIPPERGYLSSFQAMVENTSKPVVCTAEGQGDLREMWEIGKIVRGGEASLQARPYAIHYAEPISPLRQAFSGVDKLLFCAEKGIPVVYSPAPISGSTAPITVAGHVAQGLAECLCGIVIHQLKKKGAPIIMGMGPAVLDMVTGECSYNAPEYYLSYMAIIEMSHFYNLPSWGYAGTSDSQIPDGQASFEAGFITFLSAMAGANLNHDVGYLDFGRTGSLEMVVIMDEVIGQVKRLLRGIPVDDAMLALDVIDRVGPGGQFLIEDHTVNHVRGTQWRPTLISRDGYERWKASGGLSLKDRASQKLDELLESHKPRELPPRKKNRIHRRVEEFHL